VLGVVDREDELLVNVLADVPLAVEEVAFDDVLDEEKVVVLVVAAEVVLGNDVVFDAEREDELVAVDIDVVLVVVEIPGLVVVDVELLENKDGPEALLEDREVDDVEPPDVVIVVVDIVVVILLETTEEVVDEVVELNRVVRVDVIELVNEDDVRLEFVVVAEVVEVAF
jgi:hypothetical protein